MLLKKFYKPHFHYLRFGINLSLTTETFTKPTWWNVKWSQYLLIYKKPLLSDKESVTHTKE